MYDADSCKFYYSPFYLSLSLHIQLAIIMAIKIETMMIIRAVAVIHIVTCLQNYYSNPNYCLLNLKMRKSTKMKDP